MVKKVPTAATLLAGAGVVVGAALLSGGSAGASTTAPTHVRLEEVSRTMTLASHATTTVSSVCAPGEAATGGSPTGWSAHVRVLRQNVFFDGTRSGWSVQFKNTASTSQTVSVTMGALCIAPAYMTH
ncbi:MAG TPA: hypothetical protein VFL94_16925 [Actinomycetales bacterium]|nr:hypothetical protein [Actinomycetales bacterium]